MAIVDPVRSEVLPVGLPMPKDADLLDAGATRVRVRTVRDRFPFPIPNGWFPVALASELVPGQVIAVYYFATDLVVFRTEGGEARVLDAYCPHLGAHLAVGGIVRGEHLACPFHGWTFDGASGACVEIPYATSERIPSQARVRTYPVIERNGLVFAWHHLEGGDPFFEVPVVDEFEDPGWLTPRLIEFRVSTSCQEMAENNHDFAHFKFVHGTDEIPAGSELIEGTYKRTESPGLVRETFGLGLGIVRSPGFMSFLSTVTPIDEDNVHVRWTFTVKGERDGGDLDWLSIDPASGADDPVSAIARSFAEGVSQDIPIWENKVYRPRPVLTAQEKGILAHRRWSRQFYSGLDDA
ncbi:MAG: aromatic ring-hydroxylating dioxygenase subunit alpha [Actinomycetota bacterium]|nr:aromatic ring-hydroxylating dioxygenase subunit alpha [Actinomycetota bacterium]